MRRQHLTSLMVVTIACFGCASTFNLGSSRHDYASAFGQENGPIVMAQASSDARQRVPACKTNLADQLEDLDVPGVAAAIIKNGRVVCSSAAGLANIEQKMPATAD